MQQAHKASKEIKESQVNLVRKGRTVSKVFKGLKVFRAIKVTRA